MLQQEVRKRVEQATVTINVNSPKSRARGIVVSGRFVLTAAHCVPWGGEGCVAEDLREEYKFEIEDSNGNKHEARVCAAETVVDIAALKVPAAFQPVAHLEIGEVDASPQFPVFIFTHERNWIEGNAVGIDGYHCLHIQTNRPIRDETSGSAAVNDEGKVIGIVSASLDLDCNVAPIAALPVWLINEIWKPMSENRIAP